MTGTTSGAAGQVRCPSLRQILHRLIAGTVALFNRNPWTTQTLEFLPRVSRSYYRQDALWTYHSHHFIDDPAFQRAYKRSIKASGWDYGIEWRVHTILWAAKHGRTLEGAFVECGTGRGFMTSAICEHLGWTDRPFYLFDTFESGWTNPDGGRTGETSPYYAQSVEAVAANFAEWPGVEMVVGMIPDTLPPFADATVAFLHVDMNNANAEEAALRFFWPRLAASALIVLDDYGWLGFDKSRDRIDRIGVELGFTVLALPTGQGLIIKP